MTRDELEFQISQYLDGTLSGAERVALEDRLGRDAEARALLAEYRDLDAVVKVAAGPLPSVRWDRLAERISDAVALAQNEATEPGADEAAPAAASYRITDWLRRAAAPVAAVAASVLLALGIGMAFRNPGNDGTKFTGGTTTAPTPAGTPVVVVTLSPPQAPAVGEDGTAAAETKIAIGPSPHIADAPALARYEDDLVDRPSRVVIASGTKGDRGGGGFLQ